MFIFCFILFSLQLKEYNVLYHGKMFSQISKNTPTKTIVSMCSYLNQM